MAVETLLVFIVTCVISYLYFNARSKQPPPLSGAIPLFGHGPKFIMPKDGESWWKLWSNSAVECWKKGGVVQIYVTLFPPLTHYVIGDPDNLLAVADGTVKHYFYKAFRDHFGKGLIVSTGDYWKTHRKQMNPAFTVRSVDNLMPVFNDSGRMLCEMWSSKLVEPFEHSQFIGEAVLTAVLGDVGRECNISIKDYVDAVSALDRSVSWRLGSVPLHFDFIFFLTEEGQRVRKFAKYVSAEGRKIISATRKRFKTSACENENGKSVPEIRTVLDYLVQNTDFNDIELLDEVNTVLTAGHTTTASSLTSLFILIGSYPEVQEKLYDELKEVFGCSYRDVTKDDLLRLPYLDAVVKETLRLYPAAPVVLRYSDKKVVLKNYTIPANRFYVLNFYAANRHPVWGEDRMEFRPERWLEPEKLPPQHAFATFSLGKRSCIGKNYAKVSMKVIVAHVVRRYRVFADVSKYKIKLEYLIKPAAGGIIRLEERNPDKNNT